MEYKVTTLGSIVNNRLWNESKRNFDQKKKKQRQYSTKKDNQKNDQTAWEKVVEVD